MSATRPRGIRHLGLSPATDGCGSVLANAPFDLRASQSLLPFTSWERPQNAWKTDLNSRTIGRSPGAAFKIVRDLSPRALRLQNADLGTVGANARTVRRSWLL
jgi:hypothetical protein